MESNQENKANKENQNYKINDNNHNHNKNNENILNKININIDIDSIEEFPPSYKLKEKNEKETYITNKVNNQNQNQNQIKSFNQEDDDFEKFVKNFQSINTKENKILQEEEGEGELEVNKEKEKEKNFITYKEIATQNIKTKIIKFKNKEFFFSFMAYSNINFIIISQQKKIGNLYEAEVEEPEYQIDQEEDEEELPPNYEIKCLLGNRFDNLNNFISNFIAAFLFNIFEKTEKANETKPKFIKDNEESIINKKIREDLFKNLYFINNEKSFFNEYVKCFSNILMSLDLRIENISNKENISLIEGDEFEISEKISEFMDLLRKELIDILN
jgi:hypothetical protein